MKLYRGTLEKPIVFPTSKIVTPKNLDSIDFDKVIYCEISPLGAMGNEGGILIYTLKDEDSLITYETNVSVDKLSYNALSQIIQTKANLFVGYPGGMGNYVYIKKNAEFEIDKKYKCFWYHSKNTKLRVNSSVEGVFLSVVGYMTSQNSE